MAKHVYKRVSDEFKKRSRERVAKMEREELDELLKKGQQIFERHEHLMDALRALKAAREAQGISLAQLSERTGIAKSALSRLENSPRPNPTVNTLMRIAEALGREITIKLTAPNEAA